MVNPDQNGTQVWHLLISMGLRRHSARLGRRPNDRQRNEAILLEAQFLARAAVLSLRSLQRCKDWPRITVRTQTSLIGFMAMAAGCPHAGVHTRAQHRRLRDGSGVTIRQVDIERGVHLPRLGREAAK